MGVFVYNKNMEREIKEENVKQVAKEILQSISCGIKKTATLLTLSGDLGAGKTTLTKEIARHLGVIEKVISPTFVIMKIYKTKDKKFKKLVHIDAYRLKNSKELFVLGWEEILKMKDSLVVIEWPENVKECIPKEANIAKIEHKSDTTRNIKICYN